LAEWRSSTVAVKKLKTNNELPIDEIKQFIKEADLMKEMQPHQNVVSFLGACNDPPLIVTEYLENGSLFHLLKSKQPMDMNMKIKILQEISAGMDHLSRESIIHRDLAARNILLTELNVAKVADFGMSRMIASDSSYTTNAAGPLKWMAPESLKKKKYSTKSDVWSFGVVCIEVLTRNEPYPDLTTADFALRVFAEKLTLKNSIPPETPLFLKNIILKCFEVDPEKRPSFSEIHEILINSKITDPNDIYQMSQPDPNDIYQMSELDPNDIYQMSIV